MIDLDARLARGPLRVRSVWSGGSPEVVARRIQRQRRFLFALDAAAVCVCVALVIALPRLLQAPAGSVAGTVAAFSDGSVAELSTRDTELRVEQDTSDRVVARLTGGARFQVVPRHERTFEVRAGDVRVRVLGTTFSVQQLPSGQTQVLVERGRVEVAWLGGATLLQSGQGGVFPPTAGAEIEPAPPRAAEVLPPPAQSAAPSGIDSAPQHASTGGAWREDARAGNYAKAYEELNAKPDAVRDDAGDLLLAADIARLSGHPEDAVRPLRAVCDRHSGDRRAPVAAFTLGRVLLDNLGRPADAAAAFRRARVLWPAGPLAEDAFSREADAWERAGRPDAARAAAGEYLERYPNGRHAAAMRKILAQ
jgi:transmembrane sensor